MKALKALSFLLAMTFFGVCALLTADLKEESRTPVAPAGPRDARDTTSAAAAAPVGPMRRARFSFDDYFASRDADGDGRLSLEEAHDGRTDAWRDRTERWFALCDADDDGFVTLEESRRWLEGVRARMRDAYDRFETLDADDDRTVTADEARAAPDWAAAHDTDADGQVDIYELRRAVFRSGTTQEGG